MQPVLQRELGFKRRSTPIQIQYPISDPTLFLKRTPVISLVSLQDFTVGVGRSISFLSAAILNVGCTHLEEGKWGKTRRPWAIRPEQQNQNFCGQGPCLVGRISFPVGSKE